MDESIPHDERLNANDSLSIHKKRQAAKKDGYLNIMRAIWGLVFALWIFYLVEVMREMFSSASN